MEHCKHIESLSREEALELLKQHRIIAWRESDQGWAGMLCSNGIEYDKDGTNRWKYAGCYGPIFQCNRCLAEFNYDGKYMINSY